MVRIIGIILIIISFAIMSVFIIIPAIAPSLDDIAPIRDLFQTMFCAQHEKISADYDVYTRPGEYDRSMTLSCVNSENQQRDVSGQPILYGIVGYLIPFLVGLVLTIVGGGNRWSRAPVTFSGGFTSTGDTQGYSSNYQNSPTSLTDRLQELKLAHDAGLITQEEYETRRKDIINEA